MMSSDYTRGDYIQDRYRVIRVLQGGMGKVYIAYDIALDQTVAIKTLPRQLLADQDTIEMFLSEAQIWILLERHTNIVQAKSSLLVADQPFIIVEYMEGGDLTRLLSRGPLDIRTAIMLAMQFCAGADYAYRKLRLVHKDIKPANLLLTANGVLKITDFGLSRIGTAYQSKGDIVGTPTYMAPEQWLDMDAVTKQSDIYSFGLVLYEMLTGNHPFPYRTLEEIRKAHLEYPVADPKTFNPAIPDELSAVVLKCLEKNPLGRFFHYEDLSEHLRAILNNRLGGMFTKELKGKLIQQIESPAELLNSGDSLFIIGKYHEALSYYDRLLGIDPQSAKFWQRKGETLYRLKRYPEAELYFGKALRIEPSNLDSVKGYIKCLIHLGRKEEALDQCSPALALNPNDRELLRIKQDLLTERIEEIEQEIFNVEHFDPVHKTVEITDSSDQIEISTRKESA